MGVKALVVPTIYTAIDKLSTPLKYMQKNATKFASVAEAGLARADRFMRKFTPNISDAAKEFLSFASAAAVTAGIISTIHFSVDSLKQYEDSLVSFRTIVGGTDAEFKKFSDQALLVGKQTKKSGIEVVQAFEAVAGLNADLAKTPEILGEVAKSAIILAKGSGDELNKSAENLVGIMNQFNLAGDQATRVIDVLAAGQAVGASNISKTADAFTVFGAVAKTANISIEQSTALVQVLGSKMIMGSEAGTALRSTIGLLQKSGVGYKKGQFDINEALEESKKKYDKLKTAKEKDAFISKTFGEVNKSTATILLNNIGLYKDFVTGVSKAGAAQEAAEIKSRTLNVRLKELKAKWVNMVLGSEAAGSGVNKFSNAIGWLTDNLETVLSWTVNLVGAYLALRAAIIVSQVALAAYNIANGVYNAFSATSLVLTNKNALAQAAYATTSKILAGGLYILEGAQWLWNIAVAANPLGLFLVTTLAIIAAIVALTVAIVKIVENWNDWGAAIAVILGPFGYVISLIQSFRRNWDLISAAFEKGDIMGALKLIGATILDAVLQPLQQLLQIIAKITGFDWAASAAKGIGDLRADMGVNVTTDENGNPIDNKPAINSQAEKEENATRNMQANQNANVNINIKDPGGNVAGAQSSQSFVKINSTSTMKR